MKSLDFQRPILVIQKMLICIFLFISTNQGRPRLMRSLCESFDVKVIYTNGRFLHTEISLNSTAILNCMERYSLKSLTIRVLDENDTAFGSVDLMALASERRNLSKTYFEHVSLTKCAGRKITVYFDLTCEGSRLDCEGCLDLSKDVVCPGREPPPSRHDPPWRPPELTDHGPALSPATISCFVLLTLTIVVLLTYLVWKRSWKTRESLHRSSGDTFDLFCANDIIIFHEDDVDLTKFKKFVDCMKARFEQTTVVDQTMLTRIARNIHDWIDNDFRNYSIVIHVVGGRNEMSSCEKQILKSPCNIDGLPRKLIFVSFDNTLRMSNYNDLHPAFTTCLTNIDTDIENFIRNLSTYIDSENPSTERLPLY